MELKLAKMMLSIIGGMSMVGYEKFRNMNSTTCRLKGADDIWRNLCSCCRSFISVTSFMGLLYIWAQDLYTY